MLPAGIQLRFRPLEKAPQEIFESGDTLRIGQSGLLVPADTPLDDCACLELQVSWSGGRNKRYLGELVGMIEEESTKWMCVKLHTVSREVYEATVEGGCPKDWIDVVAT